MSKPLDVYFSDDDAGMTTGRFSFYFGYEATVCPHHGNDSDCECDERDWCFTASEGGEEVARFTCAELDADLKDHFNEPPVLLLAGIGRFLA